MSLLRHCCLSHQRKEHPQGCDSTQDPTARSINRYESQPNFTVSTYRYGRRWYTGKACYCCCKLEGNTPRNSTKGDAGGKQQETRRRIGNADTATARITHLPGGLRGDERRPPQRRGDSSSNSLEPTNDSCCHHGRKGDGF